MSEYQVQSIEEEAKMTRKALFKRKTSTVNVGVPKMVAYCDKVIFLCREIRKLNHNK